MVHRNNSWKAAGRGGRSRLRADFVKIIAVSGKDARKKSMVGKKEAGGSLPSEHRVVWEGVEGTPES